MKEKITAFVLALTIALGLSACDGTKTGTANDNDVMGDEHNNVQQSTGTDTHTGSGTDTGNNSSAYAGGTYRSGVGGYSTTNPANGYRQGVSWQKMLQNGRVHDSDGYLLDGENARWD